MKYREIFLLAPTTGNATAQGIHKAHNGRKEGLH
jgi:hypothetical protein